jgi:hypothetical protein
LGDVATVCIREADVDHEQVRWILLGQGDRVLSEARLDHIEPLLLQAAAEQAP